MTPDSPHQAGQQDTPRAFLSDPNPLGCAAREIPDRKPSTWDLVATVREDIEVLEPFVRHHLDAGCGRIYLFFDDPMDPAIRHFSANRSITCEPSCRGSRQSHEAVQSTNATMAARQSDADWIAHIDADELLYAPEGMGWALSRVGPEYNQVVAKPLEAVFPAKGDLDTVFGTNRFRSPIPDELARQVYKSTHRLMHNGMTGHLMGKGIVRRSGVTAVNRLHFWSHAGQNDPLPFPKPYPEIRLLHFDALSFPCWCRKFRMRVERQTGMANMGKQRIAQMQWFSEALEKGPKALRKLFHELYVIDKARERLLAGANGLATIDWQKPLPR